MSIRRKFVISFAALCIAGLHAVSVVRAQPPEANGPDTVVWPTGVQEQDLANVQAALDEGGRVLLKSRDHAGAPAAFNFGPNDCPVDAGRLGVNITRDVRLAGERDAGARTTIVGGCIPVAVTEKVNFGIEGIHFDSPANSAIVVVRSAGAEIVGNRISDVVPFQLIFPPLTEGRGIKFLGNQDPENAITGQIVVADNTIEGLTAQLSEALVFDRVAADIRIQGNTIDGAPQTGIYIVRPGGHVNVAQNTVRPGVDVGGGSLGNGMWMYGGSGGGYHIEDNTILCENPLADGIILTGGADWGEPIESAVIRRNDITMTDTSFGGIALVDEVSGSYIGQNRLRGESLYGIAIWPFTPGATAVDNTLGGNNLDEMDADLADLFLLPGTSGTVARGHFDSVLDLGTDNHVTGAGPMKDAPHRGAKDRAWPGANVPGLVP